MSTDESGTGQEIFDASSCLYLFIDKDARWFQNGAEIVHPEIYALFNKNLEPDGEGGYRIRIGREICSVHVEDAPFVVREVFADEQDRLCIALNDGTTEVFDPKVFRIGAENIPYCDVKDGRFHARFSRQAYYSLAKHIKGNENDTGFVFELNGEQFPVKYSEKPTE